MARIVPRNAFGAPGYHHKEWGASRQTEGSDKWLSPEGVKTAVAITNTVGGALSNVVSEKMERDAITDEIELGRKLSAMAKKAMVQREGADVAALQKAILAQGGKLPKYGADAEWGSETMEALKGLQDKRAVKLFDKGARGSQFTEYDLAQKAAGGPVDRIIAQAGSALGFEGSNPVAMEAARLEAQAIEDKALARQSAAEGYRLAAGAETMAQRKAASDLSMKAYDRRRAATLTGQLAGEGQSAITEDLKRLFPGRKPQKRGGSGAAPGRVREPHRLHGAVHTSQTAQDLVTIQALKNNPLDQRYVSPLGATEVTGMDGFKVGMPALHPTEDQLRRMKSGEAERRQVMVERVRGYQDRLNLTKHPMLDDFIAMNQRAQSNLTAAMGASTYTNINDLEFRQQVGDPVAALMASGAPIGAILERLRADEGLRTRMRDYGNYSQGTGRGASGVSPKKKKEDDLIDQVEKDSILGNVIGSVGDLLKKAEKERRAREKGKGKEPEPKPEPEPEPKPKYKPGSAEEAASYKDYDKGTDSKAEIVQRKKRRRKRSRNRRLTLDGVPVQPRGGVTGAQGVGPKEQEDRSGSTKARQVAAKEANKQASRVNREKEIAKQVRLLSGKFLIKRGKYNPRTAEGRANRRRWKKDAAKFLRDNPDNSSFRKAKGLALKGQGI